MRRRSANNLQTPKKSEQLSSWVGSNKMDEEKKEEIINKMNEGMNVFFLVVVVEGERRKAGKICIQKMTRRGAYVRV